MIEGILAFIGAAVLVVGGLVGVVIGGTTIWCRLRSGVWWWDEAADGVESGR